MSKVTFSMKLMHLRTGLVCKHYVEVHLDHFMCIRGYSNLTSLPKSSTVNSNRCKPPVLSSCSAVISIDVRQDYLLFLLFWEGGGGVSYKFNFIAELSRLVTSSDGHALFSLWAYHI